MRFVVVSTKLRRETNLFHHLIWFSPSIASFFPIFHARMLLQTLLLLLLFLGVATGTPLACANRSQAVALIAATCLRRHDCTFEAPVDLDWDTLLVEDLNLVRSYALDPEPDIRQRFQQWTTEYDTPLVTYDDPGAVPGDCVATIATPPQQAQLVVFEVMSYLDHLAESSNCSDVNEIGMMHSNGTILCECAQGKICRAAAGGRTETVLVILGSVTLSLAALVVVFTIGYGIWVMVHAIPLRSGIV
jgi:hypothetical protein